MSVPGDTLGRNEYLRGGATPATGNAVGAVNAASAVSWGAIFAGAAAAAALSMILLVLGLGLGLSSVSPWSQSGIGSAALGFSTIVWVTVTQLLASGMGGYLAGRLRTKWAGVHTDEVYFRDTAHGFLSWAVASLVTAAVLGSAMSSIVGKGVDAGATVAGGAMATAATAATAGAGMAAKGGDSDQGGPAAYFIDRLFRREVGAPASTAPAATPTAGSAPATGDAAASAPTAVATPSTPTTPASANGPAGDNKAASSAASAAEVTRIFVRSVRAGALPPEDARYVGQLVAQRTGLSQADAEKRVTDTFGRMQAQVRDAETAAKEAADKTRKASAYGALWLFISLLAGAFVASLMATYGGRERDL